MKTRILAFLLAVCAVSGVAAAPRTVTLDVQNMTCPVCPLTVKKALERVSGVQHVTVDYASKTATVQFDDATATADTLTAATQAAGYPSTVKKDGI
jgi:mercuric ion binding protein